MITVAPTVMIDMYEVEVAEDRSIRAASLEYNLHFGILEFTTN